MTPLRTPRLLLRDLTQQDLPILFAIRNDSACAKYQRWDDTSMEAISALITAHKADLFPSYAGEQRYAVSLPCGRCIGDLTIFYNEEDRCFTLGITIAPEQQRKGYAHEILSAVKSDLRNFAPKEELVALIHPENNASKTLFRKLGFVFECYAQSIDSDIYSITVKEGNRNNND